MTSQFNLTGVRYLSLVCLGFSVVADIGPTPAYQTALMFFAFITSHFEFPVFVSLLLVLIPLTFLLDIIWAIINGIENESGVMVFAIVFTVLIMLLKIPLFYFTIALFNERNYLFGSLIQVPDHCQNSSKPDESASVYYPPTGNAEEPLCEHFKPSHADNHNSNQVTV